MIYQPLLDERFDLGIIESLMYEDFNGEIKDSGKSDKPMCRSHRRNVCSLYGRLLKINTISLGYVKWISYIRCVGKRGMELLTTLTLLKTIKI